MGQFADHGLNGFTVAISPLASHVNGRDRLDIRMVTKGFTFLRIGQMHLSDGAFQQAQREYSNATDALRQKRVSDLRVGIIPPALEKQLAAAAEKDRIGIISQWLSEKIDADPTLEGHPLLLDELALLFTETEEAFLHKS